MIEAGQSRGADLEPAVVFLDGYAIKGVVLH